MDCKKLNLLYGFLLISTLVIGQSLEEQNKLHSCQASWKYLLLRTNIEGQILFFQQPYTDCGGLSNASNAIIITNGGDTIRVLQLCDNNPTDSADRLQAKDYVIVTPFNKITSAGEVPSDPYSCDMNETYFGNIKKRE